MAPPVWVGDPGIFSDSGVFSKVGVETVRWCGIIPSMYPQYTKDTRKAAKRIIESWASLQWKVLGHHFTRDDMIQEGYVVLAKLVERYPDRPEDHMLNTLARSLQNRSRDLAARPDRLPTVTDLTAEGKDSVWEATSEDTIEGDRPDWVRRVVDFARSANRKQLSVIGGPNGDAYIAKMCGLDSKLPLKKLLAEALA